MDEVPLWPWAHSSAKDSSLQNDKAAAKKSFFNFYHQAFFWMSGLSYINKSNNGSIQDDSPPSPHFTSPLHPLSLAISTPLRWTANVNSTASPEMLLCHALRTYTNAVPKSNWVLSWMPLHPAAPTLPPSFNALWTEDASVLMEILYVWKTSTA